MILDQLWKISRSVWASRETKLIQDWNYHLELFSSKSQASQQIWLDSGFALCKVSLCEYTTRLVERHICVGAAIGNIATEEVWKKKPVYVHQINVDAAPMEVRNELIKWVDTRHAPFSGEQCWDDMFFEFTLKLAHPVGSTESVDLDYIKTYRNGRALVRHYAVPTTHENLIGEDVQIKITYESVIPKHLTSFEAFFPWLTQRCDLRISLNGALSYFVVVPKALIQTSVKIRHELYAHKAEAAINSTELLLAESAVVLRWGWKP